MAAEEIEEPPQAHQILAFGIFLQTPLFCPPRHCETFAPCNWGGNGLEKLKYVHPFFADRFGEYIYIYIL